MQSAIREQTTMNIILCFSEKLPEAKLHYYNSNDLNNIENHITLEITTLDLQKIMKINRNWNLENVLSWNSWYVVSGSGQGQIKHLEWIKRKAKLCDT